MDVRQCTQCGKVKPLEEYYKSGVVISTWCKQCENGRNLERYHEKKQGLPAKKRTGKKPKPEKYADSVLGNMDLDHFDIPFDSDDY